MKQLDSLDVPGGAVGVAVEAETPAERRALMMVEGAILPTLVKLSIPNLISLCSVAVVSIAETAYVARLGLASLGGIALAFPIFMLMQMLSAGALGGTVSGAVSRAFGAEDRLRAESVAISALAIGLVFGLAFAAMIFTLGAPLFRLMGGEGGILQEAVAYASMAALAVIPIWATNMLASAARGSGNMVVPAYTLLAAGLVQIGVGGAFGFGLGPLPRLGIVGVALGQVVAFTASAAFLAAYLRSERSRLRMTFDLSQVSLTEITAIMRIGGIAMLSPLLSVASVVTLTAIVARYGEAALAGYGIAVRLEFLLIPLAFSVGIACVPLVGTAIGRHDIARARAVAWTAGSLAAGVLGLVGALLWLSPNLWVAMFTQEPEVTRVAETYFRIAALGFPFFGLGLCLYFAAQGAGKVGGPIAAQGMRLLVVVVGGVLLANYGAPLWWAFVLSSAGMVVMGLATALLVKRTGW
ncbi:MATE family efflux transporter [Qipengyuania qiaonensis]|uniref:Multidrug-efflux transporter n=1 Tax=Qipengyuania qiaonensis TaxID=2867240 RepID=A0ABS7J2P4_9SPHN|nr:MATE family efflux transporter [Qipengyuania qiaonensis]MBX7481600.1 MATE family efflux transporter [Qipengyuania qiaonensis]